jgi:hypothetical protein
MRTPERALLPDTVEEVWFGVIAGARIRDRGHAGERRVASARCDRRRHRNQLGELAKVLGGGGEVELIAGAVRPT